MWASPITLDPAWSGILAYGSRGVVPGSTASSHIETEIIVQGLLLLGIAKSKSDIHIGF